MTIRARSLRPALSRSPITGSASHTTGTDRLSTNAFPNAAITSTGERGAARPVARAAAVTTASGLTRSEKPATTISIPMRGSTDGREEAVGSYVGPEHKKGAASHRRRPAPHACAAARWHRSHLVDRVALCLEELDDAVLPHQVSGAHDDQGVVLARDEAIEFRNPVAIPAREEHAPKTGRLVEMPIQQAVQRRHVSCGPRISNRRQVFRRLFRRRAIHEHLLLIGTTEAVE